MVDDGWVFSANRFDSEIEMVRTCYEVGESDVQNVSYSSILPRAYNSWLSAEM